MPCTTTGKKYEDTNTKLEMMTRRKVVVKLGFNF